ncbi:hypothetical protein HUJ04_000247 [Dendroctonus ponderosae]|nr:hypothetical protein HUJ04_000247 [Dendroctonus ponderosae]
MGATRTASARRRGANAEPDGSSGSTGQFFARSRSNLLRCRCATGLVRVHDSHAATGLAPPGFGSGNARFEPLVRSEPDRVPLGGPGGFQGWPRLRVQARPAFVSCDARGASQPKNPMT